MAPEKPNKTGKGKAAIDGDYKPPNTRYRAQNRSFRDQPEDDSEEELDMKPPAGILISSESPAATAVGAGSGDELPASIGPSSSSRNSVDHPFARPLPAVDRPSVFSSQLSANSTPLNPPLPRANNTTPVRPSHGQSNPGGLSLSFVMGSTPGARGMGRQEPGIPAGRGRGTAYGFGGPRGGLPAGDGVPDNNMSPRLARAVEDRRRKEAAAAAAWEVEQAEREREREHRLRMLIEDAVSRRRE